jgi:hypothetical protein
MVVFEQVRQTILLLRGQRVILDADLARLYGVTTKAFNQQVKRNRDRFPEDFMFQLTWEEAADSRSQFVTLNEGSKPQRLRSQIATLKPGQNMKYRPYAFTEHGAIMAATVLNSKEAVKASLFVVRAFVQLRELLSTHRDLAAKLDELEKKLQNHDDQILALVDAIRQLMEEPEEAEERKPPIGFQTEIGPEARSGKRRALKRGRD